MSWRLAGSLEQLRSQINDKFPNRSKASDGTIGDAAHKAKGSASDHNEFNGIVHAFDATHDPAHFDAHTFARSVLAKNADPRIKYIISNGEVWDPIRGWHKYTGSNPHKKHIHVSVNHANADNALPWKMGTSRPFTVRVGTLPIAGAFRNPQGVTMVPLRALAEALGSVVEFDDDTNTVTVTKP